MKQIRCPGVVYRWNEETKRKEFLPCNALLCEADDGSKIRIVCKKCKSRLVINVRKTLGSNSLIEIKQEQG